MIPTVTQQLEAIRRRLTETVVPALPESAHFAHEQVLLIDATLGSLIECHEHEYRYAVVEYQDYRTTLAEFAQMIASDEREVIDILDEDGPSVTEAATPLHVITEKTRRMKVVTDQLYQRLSGRSAGGDSSAAALMARLAARQVERESSWFRQAGFTRDDAMPIGALLEGYR